MKIGNKFLTLNRVDNVLFNDFQCIIQVYFDRTKMLLERFEDRSEYEKLKGQIKFEIELKNALKI